LEIAAPAGPIPVLGLDFTSAPRTAKPITCARCLLRGTDLVVERLDRLTGFAAFEALLRSKGPWVAGMDFPFGQPRRLLDHLGWEPEWEALVRRVEALGVGGFVALLDRYRAQRPAGDKQHLRVTDRLAGALSPMMVYGVPVGRMFASGAPRLLTAPVSVLPCRPRTGDRVVLETYPAMVVRRLLGRSPYKCEQRARDDTARRNARREMLEALLSGALAPAYGLQVRIPGVLAQQLLVDFTGDLLDALLCALQAAWGSREKSFGLPAAADPVEGWICDPSLSARKAHAEPTRLI